ncbi:MAG: UDP-glucose/GDP-mannose dehydrogenase family protein [Candidatus Eisenbacteria bacterium]|nr:UDP-glucose/GDP-mannose dehydrogenase family protein [Candidatus Eisenbacteria bacterium]
MQKACMIGAGYVGLVTGVCLADFGNKVTCVDLDEEKIGALLAGQMPFYEPGLEEIVRRNVREGRLSFTSDLPRAIRDNQVVFIAVGTPQSDSGHADLSQVFSAARAIARNLNGYKLIVQKSTVPVGTGEEVLRIIKQNRRGNVPFDVASNPEFLREGSAVEDFMRPDRVVIGTWSRRAEGLLAEIYRPLYLIETPMVRTNVQTAELIKYASNAFLATKISFINEMANLCEIVGADVKVVARGMGLDKRIGSKFLHAGPGYGGSCFPKDTHALAALASRAGSPCEIVEATIDVNRRQRERMLEKILRIAGSVRGKEIGVLGLAFKPQTDDVRESVALDLIRGLRRRGTRIRTFDPVAMSRAAQELGRGVKFCGDAYEVAKGAQVLVIATEWNEFRMLDLRKLRRIMKSPIVVDCRNIYDPEKMVSLGFRYVGVGRGTPAARAKAARRSRRKA